MLARGFAFVTPTVHHGEIVTRFAIVNPRTTLTDITPSWIRCGEWRLTPTPLRPAAERVLVMKFGGSSVADADKIRRVAERLVARPRDRPAGRRRGLGDGQHHRPAGGAGRTTSRRARTRARWTCCSPPASASRPRCARWRSRISGHRAVSLTGSQAGIVTDTVAHQGQDRRDPAAPHRGGAGPRRDRAGGRLPGRVHRLRRDHPGPRRLRHHRGRPGGGAGRRLRDLHRRRRASSPPIPGSSRARKLSEVSATEMLEMAGSGARVLQLRSVEFARNHGVPSMYGQRSPTRGNLDSRGRNDGRRDHLRHHPHHRRGLRHAHRRARQARHRRQHLQRRRGRPHQRRHDHPERRHPRRRRRHLLDPDATTCR